jgi:hypothetical protein
MRLAPRNWTRRDEGRVHRIDLEYGRFGFDSAHLMVLGQRGAPRVFSRTLPGWRRHPAVLFAIGQGLDDDRPAEALGSIKSVTTDACIRDTFRAFLTDVLFREVIFGPRISRAFLRRFGNTLDVARDKIVTRPDTGTSLTSLHSCRSPGGSGAWAGGTPGNSGC